MTKTKIKWAATLATVLLFSTAAHAGAARAWVSGHGSDTASCGPAGTPCRTIAWALTLLNPGGEIDVQDPAGYGSFTIPFAVSIVNGGGGFTAGILGGAGGAAITITAGASDEVMLRGLNIEGAGTAATGIQVNSVKHLTLENCTVSGFTGWGVSFQPNNAGGSNAGLNITNSSIESNTTGDVLLQPGGTTGVRAVLTNVALGRTDGNAFQADGSASTGSNGVKATLTSTAVGGQIGSAGVGDGIFAEGPASGQSVHVVVNNSVLAEITGNALHADGSNAVIDAGGNSISHVGTLLSLTNSGNANTFGDNRAHFFSSAGNAFSSTLTYH